jgi:hypothetical protein
MRKLMSIVSLSIMFGLATNVFGSDFISIFDHSDKAGIPFYTYDIRDISPGTELISKEFCGPHEFSFSKTPIAERADKINVSVILNKMEIKLSTITLAPTNLMGSLKVTNIKGCYMLKLTKG